jgi:hypothetical protein
VIDYTRYSLQRPATTAHEQPRLQRKQSNISKKKPTGIAKRRNDHEDGDRLIDDQMR